MRGWFRRRPAPQFTPPPISPEDQLVITAWGLSRLDWLDMDTRTKVWHRENATKAAAHAPTYAE